MKSRFLGMFIVFVFTIASVRLFPAVPARGAASTVLAQSDDQAVALAMDRDGNVCVTGYSQGSGKGHDFLTLKYDADGKILWTRRYNGPGDDDDRPVGLALDKAGDLYVTGSSEGLGTGQDFSTLKYDPDGKLLWVQRYDGGVKGQDFPVALAVDGGGNAYVTGYSEGDGTGYDYLTVKYDAAGHQQWAQRYNGTGGGDDKPTALALDSTGNVYVTGSSHTTAKNIDYLTIKYDADGKLKWTRQYNGHKNGADTARALAVNATGEVYVTGSSAGSGTRQDYLTIKYSSDGKQLWTQRLNGPGNGDDIPVAAALDRSGNLYVTGESDGGYASGYDFLTVKYDTRGSVVWQQRYDSPDHSSDRATAMVLDAEGNVCVTGKSYGGPRTGDDYLTIKYSPDGKVQWSQRYNGASNGYDQPTAIAVDSAGNVCVTGCSWGGEATGLDYATVKYSRLGKQLWVKRYDGNRKDLP